MKLARVIPGDQALRRPAVAADRLKAARVDVNLAVTGAMKGRHGCTDQAKAALDALASAVAEARAAGVEGLE